MVRRCRPPGCSASRVVALWKDATGELTEIELDDEADAVLDATSIVTLMERARSPAWRAELGLPPPMRLFLESVEAVRLALDHPSTLGDVVTAAGRLRGSGDPASVVTGTLLETALGTRILAEVHAGRLGAEVLAPLADG